jgi:hypothetical protein
MSNNLNHFDKLHALNAAVIGFEFEFFSNMVRGRIIESLSKLLGKKIILTSKYHSKVPVNSDTFKLEPDYSGGSKMNELITGPMSYSEAMPVLIKVLRWIDENGWTNDKCAFQFSISFDKMRKDVVTRMENLDKLQFILGLDEGVIYSKFGNRTNNVYAKSIKKIVPRNRFTSIDDLVTIDPKIFKLPDDKYYGANFTKLKDGYIEIRYLGGRDYQKKITEIREIIDYVIIHLYNILSGRTQYSQKDLETLKQMMREYSKVVKSFSDPRAFFMHYPDIHLLVDLKGFEEGIKTYYPMIREKIFDLIVEGGVRHGFFNYDTSTGRFQLKDARCRDASYITDIDLLDCDIKGSKLLNCNMYGCSVKNSQLEECQLFTGNTVSNSKLKSTSVDYSNHLDECYIDCEDKIIDCDIKGGVIRKADLGRNSKVSDETEKVKDFEEVRQQRFISDSRLKDVNVHFKPQKFRDQNWTYKKLY